MIKPQIPGLLTFAVACVALPLTTQAATTQTVNILLQDPSVGPSISGMTLKTDTAKVKAGRVTLQAVNQSKNLVHEVLVIHAFAEGKTAAYDTKADKVDEKRVHSLGEISDLKPGARGKLTLNLKPGSYLLFCNEPGHYKAGMTAPLVVEK